MRGKHQTSKRGIKAKPLLWHSFPGTVSSIRGREEEKKTTPSQPTGIKSQAKGKLVLHFRQQWMVVDSTIKRTSRRKGKLLENLISSTKCDSYISAREPRYSSCLTMCVCVCLSTRIRIRSNGVLRREGWNQKSIVVIFERKYQFSVRFGTGMATAQAIHRANRLLAPRTDVEKLWMCWSISFKSIEYYTSLFPSSFWYCKNKKLQRRSTKHFSFLVSGKVFSQAGFIWTGILTNLM